VQVLTAKPVRLTQDPDSLAFFEGVPAGQVPRDGSWIGFKYVFHPNAGANHRDLGDAAGEPIAFYLLRPAPPDLTAADLDPFRQARGPWDFNGWPPSPRNRRNAPGP